MRHLFIAALLLPLALRPAAATCTLSADGNSMPGCTVGNCAPGLEYRGLGVTACSTESIIINPTGWSCRGCLPGCFKSATPADNWPTVDYPCIPCEAGTYSTTAKAGSCSACPAGTTTSSAASTSPSQCSLCAPGFTGSPANPGVDASGCVAASSTPSPSVSPTRTPSASPTPGFIPPTHAPDYCPSDRVFAQGFFQLPAAAAENSLGYSVVVAPQSTCSMLARSSGTLRCAPATLTASVGGTAMFFVGRSEDIPLAQMSSAPAGESCPTPSPTPSPTSTPSASGTPSASASPSAAPALQWSLRSLPAADTVSMSAGGDVIAVTSPNSGVAVSSNSGVSFTMRATPQNFAEVAVSSSGQSMIAAVWAGNVYVSSSFGASWSAASGAGTGFWRALTVSTDGSKMMAAAASGSVKTSYDSGSSWSTRSTGSGSNEYFYASSSYDMSTIYLTATGNLYTSTDSGATWTSQMTGNWRGVGASSDGTRAVAAINNGFIYTSANSGNSWTARMTDAARGWWGAASSADGSKLVAVTLTGSVYSSADFGASWTPRNSPSANAYLCAMSSDGFQFAFTSYGQGVYVTPPRPSPSPSATLTPSPSASVSQLPLPGSSWVARGPTLYWNCVAMTADGTKMVAGTYAQPDGTAGSGFVYLSTNGGVSWALTLDTSTFGLSTTGSGIGVVAISSSGSVIAATSVQTNGHVFVSTNAGATWSLSYNCNSLCAGLALSADGSTLYTGYHFAAKSTNSGASWATFPPYSSNENWKQVPPLRHLSRTVPKLTPFPSHLPQIDSPQLGYFELWFDCCLPRRAAEPNKSRRRIDKWWRIVACIRQRHWRRILQRVAVDVEFRVSHRLLPGQRTLRVDQFWSVVDRCASEPVPNVSSPCNVCGRLGHVCVCSARGELHPLPKLKHWRNMVCHRNKRPNIWRRGADLRRQHIRYERYSQRRSWLRGLADVSTLCVWLASGLRAVRLWVRKAFDRGD